MTPADHSVLDGLGEGDSSSGAGSGTALRGADTEALAKLEEVANRLLAAQECRDDDDEDEWFEADDAFSDAVTPSVVLRLIERLRKLEGAATLGLEAIDNVITAHRGQHEYGQLLAAFNALEATLSSETPASRVGAISDHSALPPDEPAGRTALAQEGGET